MLGDRVDVETPELVVVSYDLAGVGSRTIAAIIDLLVCVLVIVGVFALGVIAPKHSATFRKRQPE